jgi:hypothetical protein
MSGENSPPALVVFIKDEGMSLSKADSLTLSAAAALATLLTAATALAAALLTATALTTLLTTLATLLATLITFVSHDLSSCHETS